MSDSWQDTAPAHEPPPATAPSATDEATEEATVEATVAVPAGGDASDSPVRHHTELRSSRHVRAGVGGASDVGHRHEVNQDAYRIEVVPAGPDDDAPLLAAVLVIADGVSSAMHSDIASDHAVEAVSRRVVAHLAEHPQNAPEELAEVLAEAFALANMAVLGGTNEGRPGACTLIAGVLTPDAVSVANVGDSRAYWVGDDGSFVRMSIDDSIAQARIDMGVPREQAENGQHSHAITRWIGPEATDVTPRVLSYLPETSGWLLVCSDGLWNYASSPEEIAQLVHHLAGVPDADGQLADDHAAEQASQRLVDWALAQGGRDNVTVALARWDIGPDPQDGPDATAETLVLDHPADAAPEGDDSHPQPADGPASGDPTRWEHA